MSFLETSGIAVKTHTPDGSQDYRIGAGPFQVYRAPDRTLDALIRTLSHVTSRVFYVRAEPVQSDALVITARNQQTLQDVPHPLIPIDFELQGPDTSDIRAVHALAVERLPDVFKDVNCYVQASASTGMPGKGARARLWFEGARSTTCAELKAWLKGWEGVDTSIYHVPQPIYVAPPIFVGVLDPCPERAYMHRGTRERVEVPVIDVAPVKVYGTNMRPPSAEMALDMLRKFYAVLSKALAEPLLTDGNMSKISGQFAYLGGLLWQLPITEQDAAKAKAFDELERWHTQQSQNGYTRSWEDVLDRAQKSFEQGESKQKVPVDMVREVELQLGAGMMIAPLNLVQAAAAALNDLKGKRTKQAQAERIVLQSIVEPQHHAAPPEAVAELVARKWPGATPDQLATCVPSAVEYFAPALEHARQEATAAVHEQAQRDHAMSGVEGRLLTTKTGVPTQAAGNTLKLLRKDLAGHIRLNVRGNVIEIKGILGYDTWTPVPEGFTSWCTEHLQDTYGVADPRSITSAYTSIAAETPVDPWLDAITALPAWDRVPRAASLFSVFGCPDDLYHRAVAECWLRSIYARAVRPGCKVDEMLTLLGPQGYFKSTFLQRVVGTSWVNDSAIGEGKDVLLALARCVVYENAELAKGRDAANREKAFLSSAVDTYRAPYATAAQSHPRRWVCVGTTNEAEYLLDRTGNRRHWPIQVCTKADLTSLNIGQLWAEVRDRWAEGDTRTCLLPEETTLADTYRASVRVEDAVDDAKYVIALELEKTPSTGGISGTRVDGVLVSFAGGELRERLKDRKYSTTATSTALRELGWARKRTMNGSVWSRSR